MAKITAQEVNNLRKITGAGMMDCKKALVEAEGNVEKAIELLRKKGQKVAAKRGDNEASEGLAVALAEGNKGVVIKINCETDFVAKNDAFQDFVKKLAQIALDTDSKTIEALNTQDYEGLTIAEKVLDQIGKIGEKIEISKLDFIEADMVVAYNHPGNQVASLVGLNQDGDVVSVAGKDVAMQIAAMNPVALNRDAVPQNVIDKEIEIGKDLAIQEGKPEAMAEKIAMGRLNKFFKENTLLDQAFIKDNKKSVKQYLNEVSNGLTVTQFSRLALS